MPIPTFGDPSLLLNHLSELNNDQLSTVMEYLSNMNDESFNRLANGRFYYINDEFLQPSIDDVRSNLSCLLFRGQSNYTWGLCDSASRTKGLSSDCGRVLSQLRCTYFYELVSSTDYWKKMTTGYINNNPYPYCDDNRYLAQHYDIPTTLLDYTMNPSVAMYFATTKYDSETRTTRPLKQSDLDNSNTKYGKIFLSNYSLQDYRGPYSIIPVQMANRPAKQNGFMRDMLHPGSEQLQEFIFKQDVDFSHEIWEEFGGDDFMLSGQDSELLKNASKICAYNEFDKSTYDHIVKSGPISNEVLNELDSVIKVVPQKPKWFEDMVDQSKSIVLDFNSPTYDSLVDIVRDPDQFNLDSYYKFLSTVYTNDLNEDIKRGLTFRTK